MLIAIYSRKSKWTGKGESVENQLIMCKEYIESFIEGGKGAEIIEYEDEGFSGKNTKRPQFQKMMQDMKARKFDYLVCYKLDRLGRNLADLAGLMEQLERRGISFISIKEKFDTTTPIGKAMLYFSGVLAQMEREQIAERVKDNMIMLARSGRWLGGNTPLGFESVKQEKDSGGGKKKTAFYLQIDNDEIATAKFIFDNFLENQSLNKVLSYFLTNKIKTRNGKEYSISGIRDILTNPVYCMADKEAYEYFYDLGCQVCIDREELDGASGLMGYAKTSSSVYKNQATKHDTWVISKGQHNGIISGRDFIKVQKILIINKKKGDSFRKVKNEISLLSGMLHCTCEHQMRPKNYPASRLNERGERTFAYLCPYKDHTHGENCQVRNIHGNTLDGAVCDEILKFAEPNKGIIPLLEELKNKIQNSDTTIITEKQLLVQERDRKKEQIKNLIESLKRLGAESVSAEYINEEIQQMDIEIRQLEQQIKEETENSTEHTMLQAELDQTADTLSDFRKLFPDLSVIEKRDFLKSIVEKVIWDGELAHIYLRGAVHEKHRPIYRLLMDNYRQQWKKKFPFLYHRIAAAAGTDDSEKFPLFYLKGYMRKGDGLPCQAVI